MAQLGIMSNKGKHIFCVIALSIFAFSCGGGDTDSTTDSRPDTITKQPALIRRAFDVDSAYRYIEEQVAFGARVPGSSAHAACSVYLQEKLKSFGWEVQVQEAKVTTFNKKVLDIKNIIASYNPEKTNRVLLFAHWDTRPFADKDTKNQNDPILGANDGGSGVGVLLEIARQISLLNVPQGFDIIFFDAEDYGQPVNTMATPMQDTWCLGSQYWSKSPHKPGYTAQYGILLDMVGAADATFPLEGTSMYFAPAIIQNVWKTAHALGYEKYFINKQTGMTTDDHLYVNTILKIPSINIVHMDASTQEYGDFHHTHADNMDIIDKETLRAVGETVLSYVLK